MGKISEEFKRKEEAFDNRLKQVVDRFMMVGDHSINLFHVCSIDWGWESRSKGSPCIAIFYMTDGSKIHLKFASSGDMDSWATDFMNGVFGGNNDDTVSVRQEPGEKNPVFETPAF